MCGLATTLYIEVTYGKIKNRDVKDIETYNAINRIFKYINQQKQEPTSEQREIIEYLLKQFEEAHKWDKGSKGKLLIKHKYLEREML